MSRDAISPHAAFRCPICHGALFTQGNSLRCQSRHTFDIARQGYVNLLARQAAGLYGDRALFRARRDAFEKGFFAPLCEAVRRLSREGGVVLDAGCGEGSLLSTVLRPGQTGIGLDIAKHAVQMAAAHNPAIHYCVADLCDLPLPDASVDTLLNVLTPANYASFARVLKPGGQLIKVIPNGGHLRELREEIGKTAPPEEPQDTEAAFTKRLSLVHREKLRYTVACDVALYESVFRMTPLTFGAAPREGASGCVTVDVTILSGGFQ